MDRKGCANIRTCVCSVSVRQRVSFQVCYSKSEDPFLHFFMSALELRERWQCWSAPYEQIEDNWIVICSRGIKGYRSWSLSKDSDGPVTFGWSLSSPVAHDVHPAFFVFLLVLPSLIPPPHRKPYVVYLFRESFILGHSPNRTSQSSSWGRFLDHDILPSTLELKIKWF